ncbi:MAG: nitroreductase family protein [Negativicutes bacterium]|nr:nitroreductase family protein [Negativicutes bacterium]
MEFSQLIRERYSVRKFADQAVEQEKLQKILEAGRVAPTAKNLQPQRIYVLQSQEALLKIRAIARCAFNAPIVLLVCGDLKEGWVNPFNRRNSTEMDVSIVNTHMMLQAKELGLDSTWACWFDTAAVKTAFCLPEGVEPFCLLPLGYPAPGVTPSAMHHQRKPLSETVTML